MSIELVDRICPECRTLYQADPGRLKHGRQTTCSRKCSYAQRSAKQTNRIEGTCAVCGVRVERTPSQIKQSKTEVLLCSKSCHYKGRSLGLVGRTVTRPYTIPDAIRQQSADRLRKLNAKRKAEGRYKVSEETRRKMSLATSRAIAEGRISRVSKLEILVGEILEGLGIEAVPQFRIRGVKGRFAACLDFYLPVHNAALEVNGTFWHADPRKFPDGPVYASQKRTISRYIRKRAFLESKNIRLAEVWEMDLREDPKGAVLRALSL